ncbi:MAG: substrate-binding domain-containing protein [Lachnospiraceae bacterium]|nr:substrate-binding domain-containing protein [Lachnospiraceae bacterium]
MRLKKLAVLAMSAAMAVSCMTGCGNSSSDGDSSKKFDASNEITVVSREDGSGTRGAFIELFGVEQKDENGEKVDYTTTEAIITNSTSVMMTTVAGDLYGIGYISLGSLNDTVKAIKIDGAEAIVENIKNGSYEISRPFNIATKEDISEVAQDFVDFIMSADGQQVIEDNGYISVSDAAAYAGNKPKGKIVVEGSSSVTPVMEKLKEAYLAVNTNAEIEIQESDSTTGMTSTIEGICDIGMASRELKDSETAEGISGTTIAMDGIAVIVNNNSTVEDLASEDVMKIFTGEVTKWSDVVSE